MKHSDLKKQWTLTSTYKTMSGPFGDSRMNLGLRFFGSTFLILLCAVSQLPQSQQKESGQRPSDSIPAPSPGQGGTSLPNANPFPSTYRPFPARTTLIRNATIMTAAGPSIPNGSVLLREGKIAAVGRSIDA